MAYMSTAAVARDIVEIADRVENLKLSTHLTPRSSIRGLWQAGKAKSGKKPARLMYWGFSYGTVLGSTLASLFPGRMSRVVLDGAVDIEG